MWEVLRVYNATYRDDVSYYGLMDWDVSLYIKPECKNIFREFCSDELMRTLQVENTAVETLTKLHELHDVFFLTAGYPETIGVRNRWLEGKFKFYNESMLIKCTRKQLIKGDWLLDDRPSNLIGGSYQGILMNRPWNRTFNAESYLIPRVDKVEDILNLI
jgi:5'(3')-deoxyribonucleotidase